MSRFPPIADYAFLSDCEADGAGGSGWLGGVVLSSQAGFAERFRCPPRPLRREFPVRAESHFCPRSTSLPAGDQHRGDDLAYPNRLVDGL